MYDACVPWPDRPKGAKDKSRGPKGLELEVGARRAPKLLVLYNFVISTIKCVVRPKIQTMPNFFSRLVSIPLKCKIPGTRTRRIHFLVLV